MLSKKWTTQALVFALLGAAMLVGADCARAQGAGVSPILEVRRGEVNSAAIYRNFGLILKSPTQVRRILGHDADIVTVDAGSNNEIHLFGLETGFTPLTIVDVEGVETTVEILVKGDVRHLENMLKRQFPNDAIEVLEVKGAVLLSGWVSRPENINQIVQIAEQFFPTVLNQMRIGGNQQISLKATVMEVNRTKLREMGMNFGLTRSDSFLLSTPGPITPIGGLTVTNSSAQPSFTGFQNASVTFGFMNPTSIFQGFVDALRTEGLLKVHATPMVTTHNGSPAELLNGGEAPVLVPAGLGTTAIEFKPFGIILNTVPHLLGRGRVRLQVEPSVVERDFANSVTVDGVVVPSFTVRKVSTEVEMNMGQTLVIGGLVSKRNSSATSKVPFFGELPWVGAAFSRKDYSEVETELVILVTPNYASALSDEQLPPGGPGLFTDTPTDVELFGQGLLEVPLVGPECGATWNCSECNSNGHCSRHPQGRWSGGRCTDGSCGVEAGVGAAPGLVAPVEIVPATPQGSPQGNFQQNVIQQAPPAVGASTPGRVNMSAGEGVRVRSQSPQKPVRKSGLFSPLLR